MREIKFKAKRLDNGKWAYGYGVIIADDFCVLDKRDGLYIQRPYTFRNNTHWFELCGIMCDTNTLSQFTGFKDDDGAEVYEGDIVVEREYFFESKPHMVKYDNEYGAFKFFNSGDGSLLSLDFVDMKIIGNIHDNPELLKSL